MTCTWPHSTGQKQKVRTRIQTYMTADHPAPLFVKYITLTPAVLPLYVRYRDLNLPRSASPQITSEQQWTFLMNAIKHSRRRSNYSSREKMSLKHKIKSPHEALFSSGTIPS